MEPQWSDHDSLDDEISEVPIKSKRRKRIIWTFIIMTLLTEVGLTLFFVLTPGEQGQNNTHD